MDHSALLQQAARKLGGEASLRFALGVSWLELQHWLHGEAPVPTPVFLRLVDVLSSETPPAVERRPAAAVHPFLDEPAAAGEAAGMLDRALDAAIEVAQADFGNLQLLDADGRLRIRTQRGFGAPFLDFFAVVAGHESACGVAMMTGKQFVVPDVARSDVLRGPAGDAILAAGVRAVVSTPIFGPSRRLLGMMSVHYREPGTPDARVMAMLAAIARRVGELVAAELSAA